MKYTVILFFLLSGVFINAQHTVSIKMDPASGNGWVILYKLKGSGHDYVTHTKSDDGNFTLELPANAAKGIYRIVYTTNGSPYLDFIYDDEDIALTFNPQAPNETVTFSKSDENKLFLKYLNSIGKIQYQLDSLQLAYFKVADPGTAKKMENDYSHKYSELHIAQKGFEEQSQGMLLNHFIKASRRYYAASLYKNPADYLVATKAHYFDAIDFNDPVLLNSSFIIDKINDFIFYLNGSDDTEMQNRLQKEAIATAIGKTGSNTSLAKDIEEGLINAYVSQGNIELANFLLDDYYEKLPLNYQDAGFLSDMKGQLRTAIGNKAPDITWPENDTEGSLYKLTGATYYLVIFWSSTCPHCTHELPLIYDFLKNKKDVQVLAVGLENDASKNEWLKQVPFYKGWIEVYGDNKWKNKFAREYGINATPTFLVLDAGKKIIAKPDTVQDLKNFFENKQ